MAVVELRKKNGKWLANFYVRVGAEARRESYEDHFGLLQARCSCHCRIENRSFAGDTRRIVGHCHGNP